MDETDSPGQGEVVEVAEKIVFKSRKRPANLINKRVVDNNDDEERQDKQPRDLNLESRDKNKNTTNEATGQPGSNTADRNAEEEEDDDEFEKVRQLRELQRMSKRSIRGVSVQDLDDPDRAKRYKFTLKDAADGSSGSVSGHRYGLNDAASLARELDLGNTFSVETNQRDEDAEMAKFIEERLQQVRGQMDERAQHEAPKSVDDLYGCLSSHILNMGAKQQNEEMLSSQMLSGIPEVDLGIDEKIRNIEATERAKERARDEARAKWRSNGGRSGGGSGGGGLADDGTLVPTNVAVNFVQNNRTYNRSEMALPMDARKAAAAKAAFQAQIQQQNSRGGGRHGGHGKGPADKGPPMKVVEEPVVVIGEEPRTARRLEPVTDGDRRPGRDKASDSYHLAQFKKHFRKY